MKIALYYKLIGFPNHDKKIIRMAKAIVAGHERKSYVNKKTPLVKCLVKKDLVKLIVPKQMAESIDFWMSHVAFRFGNPESYNMDKWDIRTWNQVQLILKCGAILYPSDSPNGDYELRNGGVKNINSTAIPFAKTVNFKELK